MRKEKKNLKGGWLPQILCGLLLSFTLFLFGPIDMFMANASDFWFGLEHFAHLSLLTFAVVFLVFELVFFLIRRFLPRPVYMILLAMAFGVSLMLYIQGNWLCLNNQVLSGTKPDWTKNMISMIINLIIWFSVVMGAIIFAVMKSKLFKRVISVACALVMTMEVVALGVSIFSYTSSDGIAAGEVYTTVKDAFVHSENGDVLVFMVDTLDTRIMDNMLENHSEHLSELDGFTYYRNNGGLFSKTEASVVSMLTGELSKNEEPFLVFANKAFAENKFFSVLKENGFDVNIYGTPEGLFGEDTIGKVDNLGKRNSRVKNPLSFVRWMTQMVGYRYMPEFVQPFFYRDFKENLYKQQGYKDGALPAAVTNDAKLYISLKENGVIKDNERRFFKFYKMWGSHAPYFLNREGERVEMRSVSETDQTIGVFTIIGDYLRRLKEQDLYDSSTIIILADHGYNDTGECSNPTLMVKYPNERSNGEIKVSMAPTSQLDLRATVAYGAGIENYADLGAPVHEWEGVEKRERYYYDYGWKRPAGFTFYLSPITEYIMPDDATDYKKYEPTGNVYAKP